MHSSLWLKGEYFISPPTIFVWSWYLMVLAFLSYLFSFVSFCTRSLMLIECHPSAWNYFSHLVFSVFVWVCVHESQQFCHFHPATTDFHDFPRIHSYRLYFIYLTLCWPVCLSINLEWSQQPAYLSFLCQCLHLNISISLFLSPAWSPPNSLSTVAQPSLYVTQKVLLCFVIHACTHIHTFFHTFCPLPSIKDSCFQGMALRLLCYHSPVPLLSLVGPLSCI